MNHIYLNDLGLVNALGATKAEVSHGLLQNDQTGMVLYPLVCSNKTTYVGQVRAAKLVVLPAAYKKYNCRNNQLLATAYQQIATTIEQYKQRYDLTRIGIILGTSTSGIAAGEEAFEYYQTQAEFPPEYDYAQQEIGGGSEFLAEYAGILGPHYTLSTACSSSGKAFASAARLITAGVCDVVIVGGSDALCALTVNGFAGLESISSAICQPFRAGRDGINIGEGAALFVMSKEPGAIKLSGVGESSDGYHMTAPDPTGRGAKIAILQALACAQSTPQDIGYINLHGTATPKNDEMEAAVVHELFPQGPYCSSTKPLIGHTLGAAGAQELALCWLLLCDEYNPQHLLPSQVGEGLFDPALPALNWVPANAYWQIPRFMTNNFAFGGSNISLIIEKSCLNFSLSKAP